MSTTGIPSEEFNQLSRDERFVRKLAFVIDSNLDNEQFGVEHLADAVSLSRTQLYRRLHKITGKNVNQFIREHRLKKALELLKNDVASASEIAYQVGFSSPSYFNKCFHDFYGYPPGEAKNNHQNERESGPIGFERDERIEPKFYSQQKQRIWSSIYIKYLLFAIIGVACVLILIGYLLGFNSKTPIVVKNTIAVLPFRNDSPDMKYNELCNGFMDDINSYLDRISDLRVKSRQSMEQYRNSDKDIITIGSELNVAYLIVGSFRKVNDSIRVNIQLAESNSGDILWSEIYDAKLTVEMFEFQSFIAKQVAKSMNIFINKEDEKRINRIPTQNPQAYEWSKLGHEYIETYWRDLDTLHIYAALNLFNRALRLDPNLIEAIDGKGRVYGTIVREARKGRFRYDKNYYDSTFFYFKKVLELDPQKFSVYTGLGEMYYEIGNNDSALVYMKRAIKLKPDDAWTHLQIGIVYLRKREYENAFPYLYKSLSLNREELPALYNNVGINFLQIGNYEEAEKYMQNALELQVGCAGITQYIRLLRLAGRYKQALQYIDSIQNNVDCGGLYNRNLFRIHTALKDFAKAKEYLPRNQASWVVILNAYIDKEMGEDDYAKELDLLEDHLMKIRASNKRIAGIVLQLAEINAIKDNKDISIQFLLEYERLSSEDIIHAYLEVHPIFEDLHDNPDFIAFLERAKNKRNEIVEVAAKIEKKHQF